MQGKKPANHPFFDAIVGARPNMMKMAPLLRVLENEARSTVRLVHSGQQTDFAMYDSFFSELGRIVLTGPLGYRDNLSLMRCAKLVLTDSGGVQEETSVLGVPCLTLRWNTERPVTVDLGTSELIGNDSERIRDAWNRVFAGRWKCGSPIPLWDGRTSERIVHHLRCAWGGCAYV
jgi:UDP-N-acetylglucosamine 2-epimerase